MRIPRIRWTLALGAEIALAITLCVVAYGIFLGTLGVVFPSSTGLGDLLNAQGGGLRVMPASARDLRGSGAMANVTEAPAVLEVLNPKVTRKQADAVAWLPAASGTRLRGRDGVQTAENGVASIDFDDANRLQLGPSTLVIIRESVKEVDRPARQASVLMMEGELWADVANRGKDHAMTLRVQTPAGVARVTPSARAAASMRIAVNDAKTSTYSVYSGETTVRTPRGTVTVGANQAVAVDSVGAMSGLRALPAAPVPATPAEGVRIGYKEMPPPVTFSWRPVPGATGYRFTLARDARFRHIVTSFVIGATAHRQQGLDDGTYHWRVSALVGDFESAARARTLYMKRTERGGPDLEISVPPSIVHGSTIVLEGVARRATRVLVSDTPVAVDDHGRFRYEVALNPGMNVIVIEAVDDDGNTTYQSAIVNAKP